MSCARRPWTTSGWCWRCASRRRATAQAGLQITVDAPERLPPLPAAVEVAAYRIVQEALTNVVRHARARSCTVRLALDDALTWRFVTTGSGCRRATGPGSG